MQKRFLLTFVFFIVSGSMCTASSFYENEFNASEAVLSAFDIDTSFRVDTDLFEMHSTTTRGNKWESFVDSFDKGYVYIPILKQMLSRAGVPQEFLYLAMAESEFSPKAHSPKKASGIWQIMPTTGRQLGLRIDEFIDERMDPIKSTAAAVKYLKFLYGITGKWYLAAMAYNCGIGRLQRAIKEAGSDDVWVLMDSKKKYIPAETRSYIRMIISMGIAFNDIGILKGEEKEYFLNRGATVTLAPIKIKSGITLQSVADGAGISLRELKKYNMQFKNDFIPPFENQEFDVYLPYENLLHFKQNFKPIKADLSNYYVTYHVKKGDSLYLIAKRYGISVNAIKNANSIKNNTIYSNQKLIIPLSNKYKMANSSIKGG